MALEEIWRTVDMKNRASVMATIASAIEKLNTVVLSDGLARQILQDTPLVSASLQLGRPHLGYFEGATGLLLAPTQKIQTWKSRLSISVDHKTADLSVEPTHQDIASNKPVRITQTQLKELAMT